MQIKITTEPPETVNRDGLILGFFMDERPPRGDCGLVDWRLNGLISRELYRGHIAGSFLEQTLIAYPSRISASKILLLGLGSLVDLTYEKLRLAGYRLSETMDAMLCKDFVFNIPAAGRCHLEVPGMTESMLTGCFDFLSKDIEKWATCSTGILVHESYLENVIAGVQNFQCNVRDVSTIEMI